MHVHLVDGTFELFRAYYGSPPSSDANGKEVGAARGLARSMLALLGERDVTHVAVAFDHVIESFRNDLYPGYKTGDGIEPELYAQFGLAEEACRALLDRNGVSPNDIDLFVSHQANKRIIFAAAEKLGVPPEKVVINIEQYGNTTAATIPLALNTAIEDRRLKKGDLLLMVSVGAGFTVGSMLMRWGLKE